MRYGSPIVFLDLACGDSSLAVKILCGSPFACYEGLDYPGPRFRALRT